MEFPSCPSEETIVAFALGGLAPDAIARVESHAIECAACRDLLAVALGTGALARVAGGETFGTRPEVAGGELDRGATIGRYTILGRVGRGGMGEVYAAFDPELSRKIALKLLRPDARDRARARARLLHEAKALAKLSHPNVVIVHDVGTFDGRVFIAMEFVEGVTLKEWLETGQRTPREIIAVFTKAALGLQAAHASGLVHRDFKPTNVMLTNDGAVRVMDFGLARAVSEHEGHGDAPPGRESGGDLDLTRTGELVGTPAYMAPEQFTGTTTDARTDQFSFCVALYEALYRHRPFQGDNVVSLMTNVMRGVLRVEAAATAVPARIRRMLLRGLQTDPEMRYPSISEILAELERDPATRTRAWLAVAAVTSVGVAALLGGRQLSRGQAALCAGADARLAGIWERGGDSARKRDIRRIFDANAKGDAAYLYAGVSRLLDAFVGRWAAMYRNTCEATSVRGEQSAEVLDLRMACLGERLGSVKALTDLLATADASVLDNAVSAAVALPSLEGCADVQMLRSVVPPPSDERTRARVEEIRAEIAKTRALGDAGQCTRALTAAKTVLIAAKQVGYAPLEAEADYLKGRAGDYCGDATEAVHALEDAVFSAEASRYDELAVEAAHFAAVMYADRLRDLGTARRWLRYCDAILRRLPGHPLLEAHTLLGWGVVYQMEGNDVEAVRAQERALALKDKALGSSNPDTATSSINVGLALHEPSIRSSASSARRARSSPSHCSTTPRS